MFNPCVKSSSIIGSSVPVQTAGILTPFLKIFQRIVPSAVGLSVYDRIVAVEAAKTVERGTFVGAVEVPPVGAVERFDSDQA